MPLWGAAGTVPPGRPSLRPAFLSDPCLWSSSVLSEGLRSLPRWPPRLETLSAGREMSECSPYCPARTPILTARMRPLSLFAVPYRWKAEPCSGRVSAIRPQRIRGSHGRRARHPHPPPPPAMDGGRRVDLRLRLPPRRRRRGPVEGVGPLAALPLRGGSRQASADGVFVACPVSTCAIVMFVSRSVTWLTSAATARGASPETSQRRGHAARGVDVPTGDCRPSTSKATCRSGSLGSTPTGAKGSVHILLTRSIRTCTHASWFSTIACPVRIKFNSRRQV